MPNPLIFDAWTALTFKRQFGPRQVPGQSFVAPTWVGEEHGRRLLAYKVLQAYLDNAAREFLATADEERKNEHREYGDGALLRDAALSALLGDDQTILVEGAAEDTEATDPTGEQPAEDTEGSEARRQLEWLEEWAEDERFTVKLQENERNAVGLGDGVYVLGWSEAKGRPRLRIFDPGFYFPVLHDGNEDEFPDRVHIAWEYEKDGSRGKETWVRRMTWELVDLEVPQTLPWNDEPATKTCLFTDASWKLEGSVSDIDNLTRATATYHQNEDGEELNQLDLGIDFLPVVHVSNTVAVLDHYGQSVIAKVAQVLDDISNVDTDLAAAAATTGSPPIALSGHADPGEELTYRPGTVFRTGDGRMDILDTSKSLDALLKQLSQLLDRLSINGRTPAAILGRVNPGEVPSGVAIALSFGPLTSLVREMRLARKEKYRLLFKFVHRLALAGGVAELPTQHATTDLEFGGFLPNDEAAAVQLVTRLLEAKAISLDQAVMILRASGIVSRDQQEEIASIQSRDFDAANRLLDATGDQAAVLRFLGIDGTPVVRPTPGGGSTLPDVSEAAEEPDDGLGGLLNPEVPETPPTVL